MPRLGPLIPLVAGLRPLRLFSLLWLVTGSWHSIVGEGGCLWSIKLALPPSLFRGLSLRRLHFVKIDSLLHLIVERVESL